VKEYKIMKRFSLFHIAAFAAISLVAFNPALKADEYNRKTIFTISAPLEVPGVVLAPGTYVVRLFNSSNDRHIVQFMTEDQKKQLALTFAVAADRVRHTGRTVLTMYEGSRGAPPALRTWFYPGDVVGQEFLYPHQQAVRISERTNQAVPEVETGQATSAKETAAVVTPAAEPVPSEAESVQSKPSAGEAVLSARAEPAPAPEPAPIAAPEPQQAAPEAQPEPSAEAEPVQTAAATTDKSLPQTAGNGPLAALIGGLSLVLAFGVGEMRRRRIL